MFKEVYEFFGIFWRYTKIFAKLVLFIVLICLPFGLVYYFANLLGVNANLMGGNGMWCWHSVVWLLDL